MITDLAIDQALIELKRTEYHLLALRSARRMVDRRCTAHACLGRWVTVPAAHGWECTLCNARMSALHRPIKEHAAAKRASLDLTRKLADLRAGR